MFRMQHKRCVQNVQICKCGHIFSAHAMSLDLDSGVISVSKFLHSLHVLWVHKHVPSICILPLQTNQNCLALFRTNILLEQSKFNQNEVYLCVSETEPRCGWFKKFLLCHVYLLFSRYTQFYNYILIQSYNYTKTLALICIGQVT